MRTCVGCRARTTAADLLRVVVSGGAIVPDPGHRLPGRGAYLHLDAQCLRTAERRRAWVRALRLTTPLPDDAVAAHLDEVVGKPAVSAGSSTAVPQDRTRTAVHSSPVSDNEGRPIVSKP